MSRRLYLLITRSSLMLIVALVAAPVVDFWRFGRFTPTGGGALPIGAILPGASEAQAKEPEARSPHAAGVAPAAGEAAPAPRSPAPAQPAPDRRIASLSTAGRPGAAASSSGFEAWTAWGQVDPFWDGIDRPVRDSAAAASSPAPEETADAEADRAAVDAPSAAEPEPPRSADRSSKRARERAFLRPNPEDPRVETDGGEEPVEAPPADDDGGSAPSVDGWIVGQPRPPAPGKDDGRVAPDPSPPPPSPSGGTIGPPRTIPQDPKPKPIVYPTASIATPASAVSVGEPFDVVIHVDSVDQMTSLPFHLMFDPNLLGFESAQAGPALASLQPVLIASVNPNRPGDLAVGLSLLEASGSFSGAGDVVVLHFRAIAAGRSDLVFSRATLRGPASEPVDTRFTGGSIDVR